MRNSDGWRRVADTEETPNESEGMRQAKVGPMAERGVWIAPWLGPDGETILVAVDQHHRRIGSECRVAAGASHVLAADEMWERVERDDPIPRLHAI